MGCKNTKTVDNFSTIVSEDFETNMILEQKNKSFHKNYKLKKTIGRGSSGIVKLAIHKKSNKQYAVKIISKKDLLDDDIKAINREANIYMELKHDHIVKCFEFYDDKRYYYMVLEMMEGGELLNTIINKTIYTENEARNIIRIITTAIKYCHDKGIVHRDLKPQNLLLAKREDINTLKIADFGFAKNFTISFLDTKLGTPMFMAPDILVNQIYGKEVDMWSIGVITYLILSGHPPFNDESGNWMNLQRKIIHGQFEFESEIWDNISEPAKQLINGLLNVNPARRLTAEQVLSHPWITMDDTELENYKLNKNLSELRKFNSRKKFVGIAKVIIALNRLRHDIHVHDTGTIELEQLQP
mmetsp:Transcript_254/g.221  ORF Transcript_254/g.221 Transcript_254/m.221 type:complete len:356 (-) Transcript_254:67-1134(-)